MLMILLAAESLGSARNRRASATVVFYLIRSEVLSQCFIAAQSEVRPRAAEPPI